MDVNFSDFFSKKWLKFLGLIFGLSLIFLVVQFILISSFSMRDDFLSLFNSSMHLNDGQYWRFVCYGVAQVACYFVFSLLVWIWVCFGLNQQSCHQDMKLYAFLVWLASAVLVLVLNMWMFPASRFNWLILPGHSAVPPLLVVMVWFVYQSRFSFYGAFAFVKRYYLAIVGLIAVGLLTQLGMRTVAHYSAQAPEVSSRPNVILIGMDDLRPDVVKHMPILASFLAKSTNFTESVTPEARTFVAWTSLLTGLYPREHELRFDMQSVDTYTPRGSLAQVLKENGYTTFYSTDDAQYANVNSKYGFDHLLVPNMDAAEYLISTLNDLPLTNLISQTWIGKRFFPDTYNNRAAAFVYEPLNYNQDVLDELKTIGGRPLFLAIHFNLSHQPFYWSQRPFPINPIASDGNVANVYTTAAEDMDWQFGEFMKGLKAQGLLKNSIVVVFSDHGESLGLNRERLVSLDTYLKGSKSLGETIPALNLYAENSSKFDKLFGHGTDILSKVQWQQILGIKWFSHPQYVGNIAQRVSLIDVKSTVLDLLGIESQDSGKSLKSMVLSGKVLSQDRYFFIDTGFNPFAIQDLEHISASDVGTSLKYFEVLPDNGRLVIKSLLLSELIDQIQHAVVYKNWILASYPARHGKQVFVLVDMNTRQWTDDFSLPFAKKAPVSDLIREMKAFYGDEVKFPASPQA